MFSRENKLRSLFGMGLLIFISALVWAGIILIRDTVPFDRTEEDSISMMPESIPVHPESSVSATSDPLQPVILKSPQPPEVEPQTPLMYPTAMPGSQEATNPPVAPADPAFGRIPPEPPGIPVLPYTVPSGMTVPERLSGQEHRGILIFVIDDAGNNLHELEPFLRFPGPLTIAVLPGLPYSVEAARRIRAAGKEVILHQPMEAIGRQNPGPGAIYSWMPPREIRSIVEGNLKEIGPVAGMNNHQGSKITMDAALMEIVLTLCRDQGIYFLDSRTTADTAMPAVAKRMGIKIGERDIFLDNIQERAVMIQYVEEGLQKAEQQGMAIMIGHTWSTELAETLRDLYPNLIKQGYSLLTLSSIMGER